MPSEARVDIPFNDWSRERLAADRKHATTRTERYGQRGDRFDVAGTVYAFTHVVRVPLAVVATHFYAEEGCRTTAGFVDVWEDIHPCRGYEPDWQVWLHLFREVRNP